MFCIKCGEKNDTSANFCNNCGQPLTEVSRAKRRAQIEHSSRKGLLFLLVSVLLVTTGAALLFHDGVRQTAANWFGDEVEEPADAEAVPEPASKAFVEPEELAEPNPPEIAVPVAEQPKQKEKTVLIEEIQQKVYTVMTEAGMGSGFLFTDTGMVVTNAHVVAGVVDVIVRNVDGQEQPGRVVGISDQWDIALIQVDAYSGVAPLASELAETPIGTEVIALGSPSGFENTASIGYLTGTERNFEDGFVYEDVYQIDAQVAPGSSGGPLIDAKTGKVIGINSLLYTEDTEIGFSIPMYSMHEKLTQWANHPMSADAVLSIFGLEDEYKDYEGDVYEYEYNEPAEIGFDETTLSAFIISFRDFYELALATEDFYYVEELLVYDSEIYRGIREYIDSIVGQGLLFEFTGIEITGVEILEDHAFVHTYETFDFMNAAGEWSAKEQMKTYTVVMDKYGYYYITEITQME